ncbi:hypothetical protein LDENG_00105290, partial [Lucifuga dentata]
MIVSNVTCMKTEYIRLKNAKWLVCSNVKDLSILAFFKTCKKKIKKILKKKLNNITCFLSPSFMSVWEEAAVNVRTFNRDEPKLSSMVAISDSLLHMYSHTHTRKLLLQPSSLQNFLHLLFSHCTYLLFHCKKKKK